MYEKSSGGGLPRSGWGAIKKIFYIDKDVSILVLNILAYVSRRSKPQIPPQAAGLDPGRICRQIRYQALPAGRLRRRKSRTPAGSIGNDLGYVQAIPRR